MSSSRQKSVLFEPWLGVFETLRVEKGRAFFVEEHWASLRAATKALGLKAPEDFRKLSRELPPESGRLRWVVESQNNYALFTRENMRVKASFTLALAQQRVGSHNWDARYKTLSYLTHWQARHSVRADEALLLNERGEIASGAMSNIFWVRNGKIFTPCTEAGCRAGVVRGWVKRSVKVVEGFFSVEELALADEIFLTNSWIGVRPVNLFGKRKFKIGPVTQKLRGKIFTKLTK